MPGLDRHVRVVTGATTLTGVGRLPGRERLGRHPDRQAAALLERLVILRPVGDLVAPAGSCGGAPHWPCRASVIRQNEGAALYARYSRSQSLQASNYAPMPGYDAGKKIKGRKRHAMVDTDGRALKLHVHAADIQDRDGAGPLLRASRSSWPFVQLAFADSGYQGPRVAAASPIRIEIVRKLEGQVGFVVHARRWVVERFFAWINRNRRLAKDVEATLASAKAFLYAASAILLLRRLPR